MQDASVRQDYEVRVHFQEPRERVLDFEAAAHLAQHERSNTLRISDAFAHTLVRLCGQVNDARADACGVGGSAKDLAGAVRHAGEDISALPLRFIAPP